MHNPIFLTNFNYITASIYIHNLWQSSCSYKNSAVSLYIILKLVNEKQVELSTLARLLAQYPTATFKSIYRYNKINLLCNKRQYQVFLPLILWPTNSNNTHTLKHPLHLSSYTLLDPSLYLYKLQHKPSERMRFSNGQFKMDVEPSHRTSSQINLIELDLSLNGRQ